MMFRSILWIRQRAHVSATNTVSAIARPLITFGYARVPQDREPRPDGSAATSATGARCGADRNLCIARSAIARCSRDAPGAASDPSRRRLGAVLRQVADERRTAGAHLTQ